MMVMRAAAVPAFPESGGAEVYPSAATGESPLREHTVTYIAFAGSSERVHHKFTAENAEIEMPVIALYLRDERIHERTALLLCAEVEIKHCRRCRLTIAHDRMVLGIVELLAENRAYLLGEISVVFRIVAVTENIRHLDNCPCGVIEERRIGNSCRALV